MRIEIISRNSSYLSLLAANTILGSAMPMMIILGGLAGLMLAPTMALATLPASLSTLAGLFAAAPFSLLMGKHGRKTGFIVGAVCAFFGALVSVWALYTDSFVILCIGHLALGAALACYQFFRFAAAETVSADWQPVAISLILTSGLIAAFLGPQVFIFAKDAFSPVPLAGAYAALAVSQGIMVFLMVPTPLAMIGSGFSETVAGFVIRWHVVAMFAPSFFTGFLIKRFGVKPIAIIGLVFLISASIIALGGLTSVHFYGSLVVLGIGWNFGFIAATIMLTNCVSDDEKSIVQGANDAVIALVSTLCAFAAGAIIAGFGWAVLAATSLLLLLLAFAIFVKETHKTS